MNLGIIFPGQGSQYVGMGKNLMDFEKARLTFEEANDTLHFDLKELCFNGPDEKLKLTEFTQPAIVTHSVAYFRILKNESDLTPNFVAGHSVGEYSALVAAEALSFKDAVKAVNLRGKYMQEATPVGVGAMYAVLKLGEDEVIEACLKASSENQKVMPANFNDPTQIVISGHKEACERAVNYLKENSKTRHMAIPLKVSAPFHSSLMLPAEVKLKDFLETLSFNSPKISYIANIDAKIKDSKTTGEEVKNNLVKQVTGSVLWTQSMKTQPENTLFIECGPGKVLTGLNKKINSSFKTHTVDSDDGLLTLKGFLNDF